MKSYPSLKMSVLSFILMSGCSSYKSSPEALSSIQQKNEPIPSSSYSPNIPFPHDKAFFPLEKDFSGVYYSWRECTKKFIICFKWEKRKVSFKFSDKEAMKFFKDNDFGLIKRQGP